MTATITMNKNYNLLLVGKANTSYGLNDIKYCSSYEEVLGRYGNSTLSEAYKIATDYGAKDILLLNVQTQDDYFNIIPLIQQYQFAYIVFVDLEATEYFITSHYPIKYRSYFAHLIGRLEKSSLSTIITTDKHATLFENVDDFIQHMNDVVKFLSQCLTNAGNKNNLIVVANNLKDTKYADVILAAKLCSTDVTKYPLMSNEEVVFNISQFDNIDSFAYFKPHHVREVTIENLVNLETRRTPEKVVCIDRIIKYIKRGMVFDDFQGRLYSPTIKLQIKDRLEKVLEELKKTVIVNYEILSIDIVKVNKGSVNIICSYQVTPIKSLEKCTLESTIEVS